MKSKINPYAKQKNMTMNSIFSLKSEKLEEGSSEKREKNN